MNEPTSPNGELAAGMRVAGLTAAQLAARIGVSARTVARWLSGRAPYPHYRDQVAAAVGVPVLQLWPQFVQSEVSALYPNREAMPPRLAREVIAQARERVDVLADAAGYLWEGPGGIVSLLAARALAGVRVRVLLADPDGDVANSAAAGRSTMLAAQCRVAVGHLMPLLPVLGVDVRLHDEVLHAEVIRGDHELLVTQRVTGQTVERCPVLHLHARAGAHTAAAYLDSISYVAMRTRAIEAPSAVRTRPTHLRPVPGGTRGV
jgi:lambda repressor-like predicted transcriptional regulator